MNMQTHTLQSQVLCTCIQNLECYSQLCAAALITNMQPSLVTSTNQAHSHVPHPPAADTL
jgi:hypothetical protein